MHLAPFRTGSALSILALAAAPLHGQSVKLSGPLPPGASVTSFAADPTGEAVVYTADARTPGKIELYAVGIDASAPPYRLSAPLQAAGDVTTPFGIGATGRVVYRADPAQDETFELFSVPLDASQAPVRLHPRLAPGQDVLDFQLSRDGAQVVFLIALESAPDVLAVAPTDGSAPARALATAHGIGLYALAPSGGNVLYVVNTPIWNGLTVQLFRARLDGSSPPVLVDTESSNVTALDEIRFSPDGAWASYRVKHAYSWYYNWAEPFLVPMDGSLAPRRLFTSASNEEVASGAEFTPDGSRVVFSVSFGDANLDVLYSAPLVGIRRTIGVVDSDSVWRLAPDGSAVFFGGGRSVYGAPVDASSPMSLLATLPAGSALRGLDVSPDGTRLLFSGASSGLWQLRSVATAGGPSEILAAPPTPDANGVRGLRIAPDSERLVYEARASAAGVFELFLDRPDGTFYPLVLNAPLPANGTVVRSELIGSRWAVYLASQETAGVLELYRVPLEWPHLEPGRAPAGPPIPF